LCWSFVKMQICIACEGITATKNKVFACSSIFNLHDVIECMGQMLLVVDWVCERDRAPIRCIEESYIWRWMGSMPHEESCCGRRYFPAKLEWHGLDVTAWWQANDEWCRSLDLPALVCSNRVAWAHDMWLRRYLVGPVSVYKETSRWHMTIHMLWVKRENAMDLLWIEWE
jgi:hypothetical protein